VVTEDVPIPFSPQLERQIEPSEEKIATAVRSVLAHKG